MPHNQAMRGDVPSKATAHSTGDEFVIHSLNNYTNVFLSSTARMLNLGDREIEHVVYQLRRDASSELLRGGIRYDDLRWALTPRATHSEVAFVFDSTATGSNHYGLEISKAWLPALWSHGPKRTTISRGDLLEVPSTWVWRELDEHLVRTAHVPELATEQYFVVYLTNLSPTQVSAMDAALGQSTSAYLGYLDCSTWTPLKSCMLLPQFAIRDHDALIMPTDEDGIPHTRLPEVDCDFRLVGVEETLYGVVLDHRMDNGVPEWADEDSALTLAALGGARSPVRDLELELDQGRFIYLTSDSAGHGASVRRAGLLGLTREELVRVIQTKVAGGLIFNLRFKHGTRDGKPAPENDALMFTVQVELPDEAGKVRRYQVGIKYKPASHTGDVVTFH